MLFAIIQQTTSKSSVKVSQKFMNCDVACAQSNILISRFRTIQLKNIFRIMIILLNIFNDRLRTFKI